MYFTQVHEDAIVEFSSTDDYDVREVLYTKTIQPVFSQMVDKIVFTYRFTSLPDVDDLREDCKVYLATILSKFDPNKGSKAFSYFSVITKNWFIHKVKKNKKKVYDAVMILFDSVDDIEIFNKKAIYLYLREITGMNTKQIVSQLNKMRKRYREFQKDWNNGKI